MKPAARRLAARHLRDAFGVSERRAVRLVRVHRSTSRYLPRPERSPTLRAKLRQLALECPRYGYRMMTDRLRWEGVPVNHKCVYRLYREEGLQLPKRRRKRLRSLRRQPLLKAQELNERWSMDFMSDALADGRRFRVFNVLDEFSRECLAIEAGTSLPGCVVTQVLDGVALRRGFPKTVVVDNGPEFRGREMDRWACRNGVQLHFIDPGKPIQNAFVESFNDKLRAECLNSHWFLDLQDARRRLETWRREYNERRPHRSLGKVPPAEFARRSRELRAAMPTSGLPPQEAPINSLPRSSVPLNMDQ